MLDEEWRENFRPSKVNFSKLCEELKPYLNKKTTDMRKPDRVEEIIIICRIKEGNTRLPKYLVWEKVLC